MIEQLNEKTFLIINNLQGNPLINSLMIFSAKYLIITLIAIITLLIIRKELRLIIITALISGLTGILINQLIGLIYYHPRPFVISLGTTLISHVSDNSFPSDHTTLSLSIALIMLYFKRTRKTGITLTILSLLIGFSRVYVGVHYPLDIIGSVMTSIISSVLIYSQKKNVKKIYDKITQLLNIK